ncbi:hypothetical protein F5X68DRAFT_247629 [Plectosphaerella plurivora]|uniref:Zn(2)-C6 fungal-type domain-containing protein n=1 Tax=Plectosphaerella plurivora TaxID=936078 RepID=A0A9P8V3N0_9PEZI|nr:hypothetical protein F5X68DRAFT_247629 [Plectosphaerella plurivora]
MGTGRRFSPKVRTGCMVCKRRKVKCDEAKPSCVRCTNAGRTCQYEAHQTAQEQTLAWYRPHQLTSHDQREGRAFQYFARVVSPALSGPQDGFFWTHLVMQFGHFAPAVRHAILAISSLHEDFSTGHRISSQTTGNAFALKHYNASMRHIQETQDENLVLLTCVLFLCVDILLGNVDSAARHCRYGSAILSVAGASDWARDHLLPIFRRLNTVPMMNHPKRRVPPLPASLSAFEEHNGGPFTSLSQAEAYLADIRINAREFDPFPHVVPDYEQRAKQKILVLETLDEWISSFVPLLATPSSSHGERISLVHLRASYEILRIQVDVAAENSETAFDRHLPAFRAVIALAEEAAMLKAQLPDAKQRPCFTFEMGFLPTLTFTINKCRDLPTRLRALELLAELASPKEGFVDTGTIYRMSRRVVELEHGMSLEDATALATMQAVPLPAEEDRILIAVPERFNVNMTNDGGATYQRGIKILVRSSCGPRLAGIEYVSDDIGGPGVPALRSALRT